MSLVERSHRRSRASSRSRSLFRTVAALSVGLVLMGAAFQASFAAGGGAGGAGSSGNYGGGDDDGGIGTGGAVAIGVGGAAAIGAALGLFGAGAVATGVFLAGAPHDCKERYPDLPADHRQLTAIRLVPENSTLRNGYCRCFHLEVRSGVDRKWYSVTHRQESTIDLLEPTTCLVRQDGSKNIWCVPRTAPQSCNGQRAVLIGTFRPEGQAAMTAEASVLIRVTGEIGPERTLEPDTR